jgi:elongation factor P
MIKASDLRPGKVIYFDDNLYSVKDSQHVAKGNKRSYIQMKLKNFHTGQIIDYRARVDEDFEAPFMQSKEYEYLYYDGQDYVLADTDTYEQVPVNPEMFGDQLQFLKDNERVTCELVDGKIVTVQLPQVVELEVTDAPPVVKGATATNQAKEAIVQTGAKVKVPPFIENGEMIRVDTRTGEYVERAK